jgi:proline iminopeptidase
MRSGYVRSAAGELYFELSDGSSGVPLVCVHGGPGFTGHYLEPLKKLSDTLPVVLYDQAGCGRARRDGGRRLLTIDGFVDELEALREALGVESMHLYGHSFGGLIIGEYALKHPTRAATLTFASVSIDIPRWISDGERLVGALPLLQKMILREGNRTGATSSPPYIQALEEYYDRHVYGEARGDERLRVSIEQSDSKTYECVWGANELCVNGLVRDYSLAPRLPDISCPALFTCGRFDEATPEAHQHFASLVPGAQCVVFERSAHHPHISEQEAVLAVMRDFLAKGLA